VQGHRSTEALGVMVPARDFPETQEGIKVGRSAKPDVIGGAVGEGKVKQNQLKRPLLHRTDAKVVRLDVTMGDPEAFQFVNGLEQLDSKPLEQVEIELSVFLQAAGK
jgi:hypothetical protein